MADQLPSDNMYDILSRMPVKSLARIRCVGKQWCNYINDPYLETMHAKRAAMNDPILIMFQYQFPSDLPNSPCILSFLEYKEKPGTCTLEAVTKKPPVMEFMYTEPVSRYPNDVILGACNGLLYSSQRYPNATTLVVIHPLRRERYELPPMKITPFCFLHSRQRSWGIDLEESTRLCVEESSGLGFDESTNTFKMVCVVLRVLQDESRPDVHQLKENLCTMVHVLGTDLWRKIPQVPSFPITGEGVFVNGCLHWLISSEYYDYREAYLGRTIITFDMAKEKFGVIDPPQLLTSGLGKVHLVNLQGDIGYVYQIIFNQSVEVWVLKERGWVVHCEFQPHGLIKVLGFWNYSGDVLMTDRWKHMFVYNLKSDYLYEVRFDGWEEEGSKDIRLYQSSLFLTRCSIEK